MTINKKTILKWLVITLWICIAAGIGVLFVAAVKKNDTNQCSEVIINIHGVNNNFFVDKKDILKIITSYVGGSPEGRPIGSFDLVKIGRQLENNIWVNKALLFFDNNQKLQVNVIEREPIARVFSADGNTFYLDSSLKVLPLSEKYSARLPLFTNYPAGAKASLTKADSLLLREIALTGMAILKDSFLMAMIDQIDITPQCNFEMIPKIGKSIIVFGDGKSVDEKFAKLKLFYKEIITKSGWDYYSVVNVNFKNQVVAKRKGVEDVMADSLRAMQIMQIIASNAEKLSADSLQMMLPDNNYNTVDSSLILQSLQRDETAEAISVAPVVSEAANVDQTGNKKVIEKKTEQKKSAPVLVKKTVSKKPDVKHKPVTKKPAVSNNVNDY